LFVDGHLLWVDYELPADGFDIDSTIIFVGYPEIASLPAFF